ncbi:putative carboxylesterase [Xylariaceae sp. AK1471]|nr:putative carboxylesterase [Xylariaceae sp. AK1471]
MMSLAEILRYLRLKFLISSIRLIVRLLTPRIEAKPDAVLSIPSRDAGRMITAHVYTPPASTNSDDSNNGASHTPRPVLINFFGSSFALPLFGADDLFCREISMGTGHVVLDVAYRIGPENPFPAAIHDAEDVVRYVLSRPDAYDVARISLSGFSSGGTLALVAPTLFPANTFQSIIAFYPSVSMAKDPSERKAPVEGPKGGRMPLSWTRLCREGYIGGMDPRDPRISPLYADTSNYPKDMVVITAEYDASALDAEEFAKKARATVEGAGKRVLLRRMRGCGHNFDKSSRTIKERDEAYSLAMDILT